MPVDTYTSVSGKETRVILGDTTRGHQVALDFNNIQEAAVQSLMSHWYDQKGIALSFTLPTAVWAGWAEYKDAASPDQQWRYANPPNVVGNAPSIMSVSVELIAVA